MIGRGPDEVRSAVIELHETETADVFPAQANGSSKTQATCSSKLQANDKLIIRNRRMHRRFTLSRIRSEAGRKGGSKTQANVKQTSSSSSLCYSSSRSPSTYDARTHASPTPLENDDVRTRTAAAPADDDERTAQRTHDARAPLRAYAELAKPASGGEFADEDDIPF